MSGAPDFLLIGAAKSGTTALYRALRAHPQIFMPENKEPHFFAFPPGPLSLGGPRDPERHSQTITDWREYLKLFAHRRPGQLAGEASTYYLCSPTAPRRILEALPDVRLLVILREPARRAYANYLHLVRQGFETADSFEDALAQEPARRAAGWDYFWRYRELGYYHRQLARYFELFPHDRIRIVLYDRFRDDPSSTLRSVYAFLGVDPEFVSDESRWVNRSGVPRSRALHHLIASPPTPLRRWARWWLPAEARHRLAEAIAGLNLRLPALPEATLRELRRSYRQDLQSLEHLTGMDLALWLDDERGEPPGASTRRTR